MKAVWLLIVQELLGLLDFRYLVSVSAHRHLYEVFVPMSAALLSPPFSEACFTAVDG